MLRWLRRLLPVLILVGIVVALFYYKSRGAVTLESFRWQLLGRALADARISLLLLSVITIYACYALRALRWRRFSRYFGRATFPHVYSATLMGFACVFLLGRAGEPIRPLLIARKDQLSAPGMFGVYVLERILDSAATAVLAGLALLIFRRRDVPIAGEDPLLDAARTTGAILLVGLLIVIGFLIYLRFRSSGAITAWVEKTGRHGGWRAKLARLFGGFAEGLQAIRTWGDLAAAVGYTALHWLLVVYVYLWVSRSFGGDLGELDFVGAMLLLAFTMVGSAIQLPGVGGGTQLATFLVYTAIFGVEKELAAAAAIVLWLVTFAASCLAGLPLLLREGWSMGELRRLVRAEARETTAPTLEARDRLSGGGTLS